MNQPSAIFWNKDEKRLRALWRILFQFSIFIIVYITKTGYATNDPIYMLLSTLAVGIATVFSLWACSRWIDRRPFSSYGYHFSRRWIADFIFGLLLGAFLMSLIFGVETLSGWVRITGFWAVSRPDTPVPVGLVETVCLFLVVGFYEESLFRGYQLRNMAEGLQFLRLSPKTALLSAWVLSSFFFGALHGANPNASWISTLNLVLAGLFLGLGFILTGDLGLSIGLHIAWNFFQGNVFGLPVSGTTPIVSLISIDQKGASLVTGGAFGPEGGLIGLGAIFIGSLVILAWVRATRKKLCLARSLSIYTPRNGGDLPAVNRPDDQ